MDGFEAARKIRQLKDSTKSRIPIIATSANATRTCYKQCIDSGINDLLTKPISMDKLFKVIYKYLQVEE